jgi:hypothetical protein
MSSVGKAKEHELWKKRQEDERAKVKTVSKSFTDTELKSMILSLLKTISFPEKDLGPALRLSRIQSFRLPDIVSELERSGEVSVRDVNSERTVSLSPSRS